MWTGRLVPEKAPHLAIQAAAAAGMGIDLAGPLSDLAYYRDVVRPLLGGHARYLGHLAHADLAEVVSHAAAAVVTPVWDEPYGLVVAEALACGTPVVAFARGGIPEVLDDDRCGALVARATPVGWRRSCSGSSGSTAPTCAPTPSTTAPAPA